jgi:superfamily II DNA or RNA helicase
VNYNEFLVNKIKQKVSTDKTIDTNNMKFNCKLFDYQKSIVKWAITKGKSAVYAECGLGKTLIQLEWAKIISEHTNMPVIIFAPLSVSFQTKKEGAKFGYDVNLCKSQEDVKIGINITNYEKIDNFISNTFSGIALDEASILKSLNGSFKNKIIETYKHTPFKISLSATPTPNDYKEFGNQCEFLDVLSSSEMLAMFFINDTKDVGKWRLKFHAENLFWDWLSGWAIYVENPSDIGFDGINHILPELNIERIVINDDHYYNTNIGLTESRNIKRETIKERCDYAHNLINNSDDKWLVWCELNDEGDYLQEKIHECVQISGSTIEDKKIKYMDDFSEGNIKCMITKPKIAGFGMNWQVCNNIIFVGHTFSYETVHQSIRRCYRFGQTKCVNVFFIYTSQDSSVHDIIMKKKLQNEKMILNLKGKMSTNLNDLHKRKDIKKTEVILITKPRFI